MSDLPARRGQSGAPSPMDPFRAMRAEMDRMFERFGLPSFRRAGELDVGFRPSGGPLAGMPAVDVTEDEQAFHISAELPGLSEQDVEIGLQDDVLTLRGQKSQENERKDANYHVSERSYGSFQRGFALPPNVDREKISAAFNKGVLTITLPKTQPTPPQQKKIEIKSGG